jgi:hypothetical protein
MKDELPNADAGQVAPPAGVTRSVILVWANEKSVDEPPCYDIFREEDETYFQSIDTDGDVLYKKQGF